MVLSEPSNWLYC